MTGAPAVHGVSLLGPVLVRTAPGWAPVAGAKLQALVALLALSTPHSVSDDRLIEELWGDSQPGKPANALQAQVSQLRRVLGPDVVAREGSGYALLIEPDAVDVIRLERLVHAGREAAANGEHQEATEHFRSAVALVRGPPLGDLLDLEFACTAASRLEQLVMSAHEGFVDAELASGRHGDVVPQLTELVAANPLWERFHAQLILALFRCGRQSDALRAYQRVREVLATEIGVEPGPELRALERSVLSHDPTLAAPIPLTSSRQVATPPRTLTTFIGRTIELHTLADAMSMSRMVTVVGPAGAGKTRLALEMAGRLDPTQEWWFVELAVVTDQRSLAETVASAIGAQDRAPSGGSDAPRPAEVRVIERLGDRNVIVVFDNCEHVVDAAASFARRLLGACPALTIVATSRESLGIDGERQVAVGALTDEDATTLFSARAEAVQPDFRPDERASEEVTDLCRHLDGLPLAIELAAARTKTLPVTEIAARLQDRFRLLVGTKRSGGGRQHGLRTAIDWSYDLLLEEEQRAFRRLAVFAGGATTEGAGFACGTDALDIVARLVDKSLLVADTSGQSARYRMLESLAAYGLDRLEEAGELDDAVAAHLAWCIELAEAADIGIRGQQQIAWLDRLDAEHDNLRAALAGAVDADPVAALRLIGALILPWWFRGRGREARDWVEACLASAIDPPNAVLAKKALTWSGFLADFRSGLDGPGGLERELELADVRQRESVGLALAAGDELAVAYGRSMHSLTLTRRSLAGVAVDPAEITTLVETSAAAFERHDDAFGVSMVRTVEAVGALAAGDIERTTAAADIASAHAVRCGNRFVQGRVQWIEGLIASAAGDAGGAYRHIERGLRLLDELGMGHEVTMQARLLIDLADQRGEQELSAQWRKFVAGRGGGLARHDVLLVASTRNREGLQARADGDLARSRVAHLEALAGYTEAGVSGATAFTESCLGFLAAEMGDNEDAVAHHTAALEAAQTSREPARIALALEGIAAGFETEDAEWAAGLLGAASTLWDQAVVPGTASHREDVAAIGERARRVIGPDAFLRSYKQGAALSLAEAVAAAAVGGTGRSPGTIGGSHGSVREPAQE